MYLKYLQGLCGASGVLPASFVLTDGLYNLEPQPFTSGGFTSVFKAMYKGQPVVVKALGNVSVDELEDGHEVSGPSPDKTVDFTDVPSQRFAKEAVGWKWLRHENILPFLGVTSNPPPFSMVSPWMENGDIMSFIEATPNQNPFSLVGTSLFALDLTDPTRSSRMRQMACNIYTNTISFTVTSEG